MAVSSAEAARVAAALSIDRLGPYLRSADGDIGKAVCLYEWNLAVSGAFYEALGILEVVLRNALSEQLIARHGSRRGHWYDDPFRVLSDQAHADIAAARERIAKLGRVELPGRVIAELNFGFWKFLLAKRYEATMWTSHLRHAFPNLQPQSRAVVYRAVDQLHTLRNRVAHHEPIHERDLANDMLVLFRVLDWIDADIRSWAIDHSRLRPLIAGRPR
ncbi:MAG: hypothetical protein ACTHXA_05255 [Gulosibacter sp.]|uniref:hypothetical protein n=1 Tax=Gulosibacter sp. TaxID=2817531 RepID=UPI003F939127